ncbi:Sec20-domain-containing protein [Gaertneriomyces semiglobifer]|nr:Sec20-domain-containing protein [Gaertneriomyces semiglobifer]
MKCEKGRGTGKYCINPAIPSVVQLIPTGPVALLSVETYHTQAEMLRTKASHAAQRESVSPSQRLPTSTQRLLDSFTRSQLSIQSDIAELAALDGPSARIASRNEDIRKGLKGLLSTIEDIRTIAEEQQRPDDAEYLLEQAAYYNEQYKKLQGSLRQASLSAKRNMERTAAAERDELLKGSPQRRLERMQKMHDVKSVSQASSELTKALKHAVEIMNTEVEKSMEVVKTLEDSTRVIQQTHNEYQTFGSVLRTSRQLVTQLQRRDWTDRLLLGFGLLVFILTVLAILRRRLWIWVPGWKWVTGQCREDEWLCF